VAEVTEFDANAEEVERRPHSSTHWPVVQENIEALQALLHDAWSRGRVHSSALDMHDRGLAVELAEEVARAGEGAWCQLGQVG
jgi:hypothetical protein